MAKFKDIGEKMGGVESVSEKYYPHADIPGEIGEVGAEIEVTFKAKIKAIREDNDGLSTSLELRSVKQ